jgi:CGNR zinc finger/Putative stress-induced transcription regulator
MDALLSGLVGEEVLLELLNSTPVMHGERHDTLADDGDLARWSLARGGAGTVEEAGELRRVRDQLQAVVRHQEPPSVLAESLRDAHLVPHPGPEGISWTLDVTHDRRLAVELVLQWGRIGDQLPSRLRPCDNTDCRLFLLDRSRANNARWCSMAVCGNRIKARRHHERVREAT